ncbi:TetR/AcrR family transcriptional regulator [Paraburkholderia sp. FT54]|uniref:TetR/AcrR family transcriptional regulator n=1 Tax=Paraburkholderia sp. FT54 TaxID=3074437 RepID=UPI0028776EED|nr:TetR/AcrR family transcriptional regulator [Paraburkholderia sp. FT54]WNC93514.1 TetR/AcrR family transcriptional regulator [Paraburkholderia sp. FT54]
MASLTPPDTGNIGPRRPAELRRSEQQRAQETRSAILNAALAEFSSKGFEAASIRSIADRIGMQHPLITYHFRSKEILWQAVAEYVFERVRQEHDASLSSFGPASATDRLKLAYRALFRFTVNFPEFHRFILQESLGHSARLQWLADSILKPLIGWLLPQIRAAQTEHAVPNVEPIVFHYMMISLTSTLSGFGPEFSATSNLSPSDPVLVEEYWCTVERVVFGTLRRSSR